jgi:coenzyme F420-dependent glucose-6-phosphate dehydrogenase
VLSTSVSSYHRLEGVMELGYALSSEPAEGVPVMVAAGGPKAARLAGNLGDGLIATSPNGDLVNVFRQAGGGGKPTYGQLKVCWARDESSARRLAHEVWPTAGLAGELGQELKLPAHFQQATTTVDEEDIARVVVCGPDPAPYLERIHVYEAAGYDHLYIHQVGPDQDGFPRFYQREIHPALRPVHASQAP